MKKVLAVLVCCMLVLSFTACTKKEKVEITSVEDLAGKKVGVQAGTTGDMWVTDSIEGVEVNRFKSGMDAGMDLANGAIDAVVLDELPAKEIVARNDKLEILPLTSFAAEEYAIAVAKGNTELLNSINATIAAMKENGDYEALVNAFMPVEGEIVIPEVEAVASNKVLKLGTNAAFPPFEYYEGTEPVGFDITMGQKIAKDANAKLEVVDMDFDALIVALQSGSVDFVAAGMSVTEERQKSVDFSDPYYTSEQVVIVRK